MKRSILILISIISLAAMNQCVIPFEAESFNYEKVIVVDGLITNEDKVHQVELKYTFPIGDPQVEPLKGATLWVEGSDVGKIDFIENEEGVYSSSVSFSASANESYQLFFTTLEGGSYASSSTTLIESPPIDSIYSRYAEIATEQANTNLSGIQFFLDTHDDSDQAKFFRYEWENTYKIVTPYVSEYEYHRSTETYSQRKTFGNICYQSGSSNSMIIGNTVGSTTNRMIEFPIRFVRGDVDILRSRYSILVKQYVVSEEAYSYYRKLKQSNESGGSLFDVQQGIILGNISALHGEESVLGYFEVSGVSKLRSFFSFSDLDPRFPQPSYRYNCVLPGFIGTTEDSISIYMDRYPSWLIVNVNLAGDPQAILGPPRCIDCSHFATTQKPNFWIE